VNAKQLFGHWDEVRRGLYAALEQLTDEQLSFVPREGLWSLGQVACHIAEGEEHWFRHYIHNRWPAESDRLRLSDYGSVTALKALLAQVHARTDQWLETLDEGDLAHEVILPWGGRCSVRFAIWHILEHEIHHRGEIYLMLGLLGMEAPDV
jgi:uncharacterized damage-inducible protein DinB